VIVGQPNSLHEWKLWGSMVVGRAYPLGKQELREQVVVGWT